MLEDAPGYYYVVPKRGDDWEVWMWTGQTWNELGRSVAQHPPFPVPKGSSSATALRTAGA